VVQIKYQVLCLFAVRRVDRDWIVVPLGWHLQRDAKGLRIIFEAWRDEREN